MDLLLVPTPTDGVSTSTSQVQKETEDVHSEILRKWGKRHVGPVDGARVEVLDDDGERSGDSGWEDVKRVEEAMLERDKHVSFLHWQLGELGSGFTPLDASRPWIIFWAVNSLDILDRPIDKATRARAVATLLSFQHPFGGFGGGPGQMPHLAPTYAAVSALVNLAGDMADAEAEDEVWSRIDREGMYRWLMEIKQDDGSFIMHHGGEVDVRGCYCAMVVATLLDLVTPDLTRSLARFIASCQTYEGGLASASLPYSPTCSPQLGEAHGGYTSCAVLCHFLLQPTLRVDATGKEEWVDVEACLRWVAEMQSAPIEGGGFRGRTNKLVDGCYSWWCAGLFPILDALSSSPLSGSDAIFDREALQEYTLLIAQGPEGGLRDKPGKHPDAYHTHYNLAGLSTAQRAVVWSVDKRDAIKRSWKASRKGEQDERRKEVYASSLAWEVDVDQGRLVIGHPSNKVAPIHPCFLLKPQKVKRCLDRFYGQS